jgi:hypothetical protein
MPEAIVDAPADAITLEDAPTRTFAAATFTPGTLTMTLVGVWQHELGGGGGGGLGGLQLPHCGSAIAARPLAAITATPAPASMCRHETLIASLLCLLGGPRL